MTTTDSPQTIESAYIASMMQQIQNVNININEVSMVPK
jgi:hypothetical protein